MPTLLRRAIGAGLAAWMLVVANSCGGDDTAPPHVAMITVAPTTATILAGDTLRVTAQLVDANGKPITGREVTFASSDTTIATVDEHGLVTGVRPGAAAITVAADDRSAQAALTITAGPPAAIVKVSGDAQSGIAGTAAAQPLVVRVTDRLGFAVSGVSVQWSASGGGSISPASAATDASGQASTHVTLAPRPATSTVTAKATGVTPTVQFTAVAKWSTTRDDWTTYGHDAHRSSAVATNVVGPLRLAWKYVPPGTTGHGLVGVMNALATHDAVFVRAALSAGYGYGLNPAVDRVSLDGAHVWTYNMGTDADFGNWGALWGGKVILNDDGVRYVDVGTGKATVSLGVDYWGEMLSDASGFWLANSAQIDGPGVFIAQYDAAGKRTWTQNAYAKCRGTASATAGGLALNGSVLFYAPDYHAGADSIQLPFSSGVYAFGATSGTRSAFKATTPYSRLSADGSRVYLVESGNHLVARAQSDLHVVWSVAVTSPGVQAPVVANGLVIIATSSAVQAYDAATGTRKWSTALNGAISYPQSTYQGGRCGVIEIPAAAYAPTTTMAAALNSKTLVVTASDGIHLLSLADGRDTWHAAIAGMGTRVWNPVLVNDPTRGPILYVMDYQAVYALVP